MWFDFADIDAQSLTNPAAIVAVSTSMPQYRELYSQGRELGSYVLRKRGSDRLATIHSSSLPSEVVVHEDGLASLPACQVHVLRGERDVVLFTGDSSPMDDQYEFARAVLEYVRRLGVTELFSIGARWAENPLPPEAEPKPNGFATDATGVENLRRAGVEIVKEEPAPFFASVIVGLAGEYGIRGYKLSVDHGEPIPHPRSVASILETLKAMIGFDVPTDELRAVASERPAQIQVGDDTIYH